MIKRIDNLDYLRGLMAIGIMAYHYSAWLYSEWLFGASPSQSSLSRLGIYGVSTFYVLSGLTLFVVYSERLQLKNLAHYFVKRVFRIYPLLWISILLNIFLLNKVYDTEKLWLNFTGAFGFIAHSEYISTGAWSIGNELVFYALFPIIIFISRKIKYGFLICFGISVLVGYYFAFHELDSTKPLREQWKIYIHPFNQLFLFVGGIFIGYLFKNFRNGMVGWSLLLLSVVVFVFWPISGDRISLISEYNRFILSLTAFSLTLSFLIIPNRPIPFISKILKVSGEISYSIYLVHPIVFWYLNRFIDRNDDPLKFFFMSSLFTIILSLIIYFFVENKFILLGKKIVSSKSNTSLKNMKEEAFKEEE